MQVAAPAGSDQAPFKCPRSDGVRYYPPEAQRREIEGVAVVNCDVDKAGRPHDCHVVSETPPDWGFGDAAVVMAQCLIKLKPGTEGRRDMPLQFKLPRP